MQALLSAVFSISLAFTGGAPAAARAPSAMAARDFTPPEILTKVIPRGRRGATVEFECVVLEDGTVRIVRITKTSDPKLNDAATAAMKQWTFKPAMKDGKPVKCSVTVELTFRS